MMPPFRSGDAIAEPGQRFDAAQTNAAVAGKLR
jgi:hypothetical protein